MFLSALLTGLNLYNKLARYGGAGTLVPITGFANAVVSPAIDFKSEGFVTGMAAKMFLIAGPVIVFGTLASVLYGVILRAAWLKPAAQKAEGESPPAFPVSPLSRRAPGAQPDTASPALLPQETRRGGRGLLFRRKPRRPRCCQS